MDMTHHPLERIVLVCLNGLNGCVVESLIKRELVPNLAGVLKRSACGVLGTGKPSGPTVTDATLMTGQNTVSHGIYDRQYLDVKTQRVLAARVGLNDNADLWQALSRAGKKLISLSTRPVVRSRAEQVPIKQIPNLRTAGLVEAEIRTLAEHVSGLNLEGKQISWHRRPASLAELTKFVNDSCRVLEQIARVAERVERQAEWHVLEVGLPAFDRMMQLMWPEFGMEPGAARENRDWREPIERLIRAVDRIIGRLSALAERHSAGLVLVSGYGTGELRRLVNVNGILRIHGIQKPAGVGARLVNAGKVRLDAIHQLVNRSMSSSGWHWGYENQFLKHLKPCDWSRTLAFAPFGEHSGLIYLTPKARRHDERAERVTLEIAEIFRLMAEPVSGELIFSDVIPVATRWNIDPLAKGWPQIIAIPANGYQAMAQWPLGDQVRIFAQDSRQPGTCHDQGLVSIKAHPYRPDVVYRGQVVDFAPTVLDMVGVAIPEEMEGLPLRQLASPGIYQPHIRPVTTRKLTDSEFRFSA